MSTARKLEGRVAIVTASTDGLVDNQTILPNVDSNDVYGVYPILG